ncbi:MAG: hypothetical protein J6B67_02750 [Oscillospiraceae bacterium]|nr:hypothetical protein [Oscillospiraceae bacterium]
MKHKTVKKPIWATAIIMVLAAGIWFLTATGNLGDGQKEAGRQQLETALRRAAVACYAAEGIYPPTVQYLTDHYGIQIDREKYHVFYEVFAENLMPDITVLTAQ